MSPEQYDGRGIGPQSDQFGFCVALYEALLGQRPFAGKNASALAAAVLSGRRQPMPGGHGVPPAVLGAVLKGLSNDRRQRHRSMAHLIAALRKARDQGRRRIAVVAAGALIAGSIAGTYALANRDAPAPVDPCAAVEAPLVEIWNTERREAIAETMSATSPFSAGVWAGIEPKLDRFADRWIAQRHDACQSAQHRGEESLLLLELRYACLDRALLRMDAFLEQMDTPGPMTAMLGPGAADRIDRLWRYEDRERLVTTMHGNGLAEETDLSRSSDGLARWEAGYADLAHAEMLHALAQTEPAIEEARGVVRDANDGGLRTLEAEAQLLVGRWTRDRETLTRALDLAIASGTPSQAAEIAIAIAELATSEGGGELSLAHQHLRYAERFLERAGSSYDGSIAVRIPAVRAGLALRASDNPRARAELERALEMARERLPPDHGDTLTVLGNLGIARMRSGETAAATSIYEELLEAQIRVLGPNHPVVGRVAFNLGNAALEDRRLDDAERWFRRAGEIWVTAFGENHPQPSFSLGARAEVHRRRGDLDQALTLQTRALELRERTLGSEHPALCDALDELGEIAIAQGDTARAREHLERSLALRRRAEGPGLSTTLTKLGRARSDEPEPQEAIALLDEALALRSVDGIDPLKRAETELALARVLQTRDRPRAQALAQSALGRLHAAEGRRPQERADAERWYAEAFGETE